MLAADDFKLTDRTVERMIELLKEGISLDFIAQGLKFHHVHPSLVHYFKGPPVRGAKELAPAPAWLGTITRIERLQAVIAEHRARSIGQLATSADVMVYLYPAARAGKLQPRWTTIYSYVAEGIVARHELDGDQIGAGSGAGLTPAQERQLVELRQEIRQTVVRLARQREITRPGRPEPNSIDRLSFRQLAYGQPEKNQSLPINSEGRHR